MPDTEDVRNIDFDKAVRTASASSFWSEFHDEAPPLPWVLIAATAAAAAFGAGLWLWSRQKDPR